MCIRDRALVETGRVIDLFEDVGGTPAGQRGAHPVELTAEKSDIDHSWSGYPQACSRTGGDFSRQFQRVDTVP